MVGNESIFNLVIRIASSVQGHAEYMTVFSQEKLSSDDIPSGIDS